VLRFALDQNFPPFILDAGLYLPDVELSPIHRIDPRASSLTDRELILFLAQEGYHGLITNNYKMLWVPREVAALVKAKIALFAVEGLGDDPLRATGAVMLHLPHVAKRVVPGQAQVFRVSPRAPSPEGAWTYFTEAAERRGEDVTALYDQVKVSDQELRRLVLD
jgi:hypothetical protein